MSKLNARLMMIFYLCITACCKVDSNIKQDPISIKHVEFKILSSTNQCGTGIGNIYYTYYGEKKYLFGNSTSNETWQTTNSPSCSNISFDIPVNAKLKYSFCCTDSLSQQWVLYIIANNNVVQETTHNSSNFYGEILISN